MQRNRKIGLYQMIEKENGTGDKKHKLQVPINIPGEVFKTYYETFDTFPVTFLNYKEKSSLVRHQAIRRKKRSGICKKIEKEYKRSDRSVKHRVTINISGEIFETYFETLDNFPTTLLGDKLKRSKYFCARTNQYFFHRNRFCFEAILYFYQSNGTLNCPMGVQIDLFENECCFFGLPKVFIDKMKRREGIFPDIIDAKEDSSTDVSFRSHVWNILEDPSTSFAGWSFGLLSVTAVVLSIFSASIETLPTFQSDSQVFVTFELSIHMWFLVELFLRMSFSGNITHFLKQYMNIVDIISVIPYFTVLLLQTNTSEYFLKMLQTLKFLRVCRLFRFSKKHSKRLAVVGKIIHSCLASFRLLIICLSIVITFGGTVMYILEENPVAGEGTFHSLPASLWWCVQTITTVGYGDVIPKTFYGRLFACCFMLLGVATTSLPILTIVSQFARLYPKNVQIISNTYAGMVGGLADDGFSMPDPECIRERKYTIG